MVHNLFSSAGCHWPAVWGALKPSAGSGVYCRVRPANSPPPGGLELRQMLKTQRKDLTTPGTVISDCWLQEVEV